LQVDVICCAVDNNLNLAGSGTVANALLTIGGKSLMAECRKKHPSGVKYGQIVEIEGGHLNCKKVYLVALPDYVTEDKISYQNNLKVWYNIGAGM